LQHLDTHRWWVVGCVAHPAACLATDGAAVSEKRTWQIPSRGACTAHKRTQMSGGDSTSATGYSRGGCRPAWTARQLLSTCSRILSSSGVHLRCTSSTGLIACVGEMLVWLWPFIDFAFCAYNRIHNACECRVISDDRDHGLINILPSPPGALATDGSKLCRHRAGRASGSQHAQMQQG
jgi:hypothetical protein